MRARHDAGTHDEAQGQQQQIRLALGPGAILGAQVCVRDGEREIMLDSTKMCYSKLIIRILIYRAYSEES